MAPLKISGHLAKRLDIEAYIGYVMSQYLLHTSGPLRLRLIIVTEAVCAGMRSVQMVRANVQVQTVGIGQPCNFLALVWGCVEDALPVIADTSPTRNAAFTLLLDSPATVATESGINTLCTI